MIKFKGIEHHSVLVADITVSLDFYLKVLGLELDTSRPDMSFGGAWINVGDQAIHLLELPNPDEQSIRPEHGGRDRHVALSCADLNPLIEQLQQHEISFTQSKSGRRAIFFRDPDQNVLEVIERLD